MKSHTGFSSLISIHWNLFLRQLRDRRVIVGSILCILISFLFILHWYHVISQNKEISKDYFLMVVGITFVIPGIWGTLISTSLAHNEMRHKTVDLLLSLPMTNTQVNSLFGVPAVGITFILHCCTIPFLLLAINPIRYAYRIDYSIVGFKELILLFIVYISVYCGGEWGGKVRNVKHAWIYAILNMIFITYLFLESKHIRILVSQELLFLFFIGFIGIIFYLLSAKQFHKIESFNEDELHKQIENESIPLFSVWSVVRLFDIFGMMLKTQQSFIAHLCKGSAYKKLIHYQLFEQTSLIINSSICRGLVVMISIWSGIFLCIYVIFNAPNDMWNLMGMRKDVDAAFFDATSLFQFYKTLVLLSLFFCANKAMQIVLGERSSQRFDEMRLSNIQPNEMISVYETYSVLLFNNSFLRILLVALPWYLVVFNRTSIIYGLLFYVFLYLSIYVLYQFVALIGIIIGLSVKDEIEGNIWLLLIGLVWFTLPYVAGYLRFDFHDMIFYFSPYGLLTAFVNDINQLSSFLSISFVITIFWMLCYTLRFGASYRLESIHD
jgi:hypothetical protein